MKNEKFAFMGYESPWCRALRIDSENVLCTSGDGYGIDDYGRVEDDWN